MTHFLQIAKSFKIKNRKGNLVTLPAHYKLTGKANCYTKQLVEVMDVLCEADEELIEEQTLIQNVPCSFLSFTDD